MFCTVVGALRDAGVHVGEAKQGPPEHRHLEQPRPAEPGRADQGHVLVGHERAVEDGVVALGSPHAEGVPGLLDAVTRDVPGKEPVHNARVRGRWCPPRARRGRSSCYPRA